MIFRRSPDVPNFSDYRQYRDLYLRPDFQFSCYFNPQWTAFLVKE